MERDMLKDAAGPTEWFNGLGQDGQYALAGGLIGGGTLGGLNMLRNERKNRFRNFLAGAAAGGLGGAALGLGASRLNAPATVPDTAAGAGGGVAAATAPPPDIPEVTKSPLATPQPDQPAPEAAALGAAADFGARVGGKSLMYGAAGATGGAALGAGLRGGRAFLDQDRINTGTRGHNAALTREISQATTPIVDNHLASRKFLNDRLASIRQQQAQVAGTPVGAALRDYYARQAAAIEGRLPQLVERARADVAAAGTRLPPAAGRLQPDIAPEGPLRAAMRPAPAPWSATRAGLAAAPRGAVAPVRGFGWLGRGGRAASLGGILGLGYGAYRGTADQLTATEGQ